jgi:tetratricopeptide (TPR) repeat protein
MQLDNTLFYAFLEDLERGTPVADALAARYHKTLADLDSAIRRRGRVSGATVRFASDGIVAIPEPSELDRATLLFEMGRFLSIVPGAEKDADRHLREAVRVDPKQARALALLGRYDEAVAAAPDDPDVLLGAAEALMKTATGSFAGVFEPEAKDAAAFRKARQLAEHAAAVLHDSNLAGNALGVVGTSYLVETDPAPGIAALERAVALVPQRADFALNLYRLYLRSGQRPKADALFASTFANTRDKQLAFAARNILLSAEIERANQLSREGKLDEAATLVRELAAATEDAKAKHELEAQAVQLEATAAVNRQIRMYNQAIVYVNTSHNADALKILDAILKEATDPLVIADARRLRDELRKKK